MATTASSSSSRPLRLFSCTKPRFFTLIRRFLQARSSRKRFGPCSDPSDHKGNTRETEQEVGGVMEKVGDEDSLVLQKSVKRLHFGSSNEKEMAAEEIRRLAKEDGKARKLMAELGVIQTLVSMAADEVGGRRRAAVRALIQLADGTFKNKALMLEAGILSKLPKNIEVLDEPTRQEFVELLLSLSSMANTRVFPLISSQILPFLIGILESSSVFETKESCLGALYNLSSVLDHAGALVSNGAVQTLLKLSSSKQHPEKSLATLGHLVVTLMGKKAMEDSPVVPESLIEILTWEDRPKCQELSAYILMILAHQSSKQREKMAKAGIVPVLLEVSLLGSPLAQKRATKVLQWFKDERQAKIGPHSGPQSSRLSMGSPASPRETLEGKRMMKNLVKQSLYKNLEMITKRANGAGGESSSRFKSFVISTSSKSLPY